MNYKICNNRELYDVKYINDVLNNIEYSIFAAFNKIYPKSTHTRWDNNYQFNIYCYDSDNVHKYNIHVIISYNIFDDTYIIRLNVLNTNNVNINNIYFSFFTSEVLEPMDINKISKIIQNLMNEYIL